jgi:hypothetical protein
MADITKSILILNLQEKKKRTNPPPVSERAGHNLTNINCDKKRDLPHPECLTKDRLLCQSVNMQGLVSWAKTKDSIPLKIAS